jgi:YHS domain-containing protein
MIGRRACLAIWLAGLPIANPIGRAQSVQPAPLRLALKGYDPVAYFTAGRPTAGKPEYEAVYDGARYHFASARSLELFKADPDRYAPQYAGACTAGIAMGGSGAVADRRRQAVCLFERHHRRCHASRSGRHDRQRAGTLEDARQRTVSMRPART